MSSKNFDSYAEYYDLLYLDKDYEAESNYVDSLIREFAGDGRDVLELGCGTGIHAGYLATKGYHVVGVDRSVDMLAIARTRVDQSDTLPRSLGPTFVQADIRNFSLALFDVASYLTTTQDLKKMLSATKKHLRQGGLLIFDCWYGPAVYAQKPSQRIKRFENDSYRVVRIAEPNFDCRKNLITVNFEIFIENKQSGEIKVFDEVHPMRCYFEAELEDVLSQFGFVPRFVRQWHTGELPTVDSWSVLFGYVMSEGAT